MSSSQEEPESLNVIPTHLLEAIREKRCVLYAGAGFSLEATLPHGQRLPTGKGLGQRLATELYRNGHLAVEPTEDQPIDLAAIAEDYETAFGRQNLIELLGDIFRAEGLMPGEAHNLAIKHFPVIITTNYDDLFERAAILQGKAPIVIRRDAQIPFSQHGDRPTIIKIHGDLEDPERIVITNEDYRRTPIPQGLREKLSVFLSEKSLLFIGYSLADSNFQEIYFEVLERLGRLKPRAFMVTPFPAPEAPYRKPWELFRKRWENREVEFLNNTAGGFLRQLNERLGEPSRTVPSASPLVSPRTREPEHILRLYCNYLVEKLHRLYIIGENQARELEKVFVELSIIEEYHRPTIHAEFLGLMDAEMRRRRDPFAGDKERDVSSGVKSAKIKRWVKPDELLNASTQVVLTGAPGCGKTTLLKYLALNILREGKRLPVFLELKTVSEEDFKQARNNLVELVFAKAVAGALHLKPVEREQVRDLFLARMAADEVAIFLDGLDEVRGAEFFPALCTSVSEFVRSTYRNNMLVISTRPYALQTRFEGLKEMEIAPLNQQQIEEFLKYYFGDDAATQRLLQNLRQQRQLGELSRVPFLLTIIAQLHRNQDRIVENRLELYRQIVLHLAVKLDSEKSLPLSHFHITDPDGSLKLDFLKHLACERLFMGYVNEEVAEQEATRLIFTGEVLLEQAKQFLEKEKLGGINPRLLAADAKATPLLREVGTDVYAFAHLTIQEYLAAVGLSRRSDCEEIFCRAYFNPTLAEMEALPMTLGLTRNPEKLYAAVEQLPESLTFVNLRLRARGLSFLPHISRQLLAKLTEDLIEFLRRSGDDSEPYHHLVTGSFSVSNGESLKFIIERLTTLLRSENPAVRATVVSSLGRIGGERVIPTLLESLKDEDDKVRSRAVSALGRVGGEQGVEALLLALKDTSEYVRWDAIDALGDVGSKKAIKALTETLREDDRVSSWSSGDALAKIDKEEALAIFCDALKDEDDAVRETAANVLGEIGGERAKTALLDALKQNYSSFKQLLVYREIIDALGRIGGEQVIPILLKAVNNKEDLVRWEALTCLGRIGGEEALAALLKALEDTDGYVRGCAAEALGEIGGERAKAALFKVLDDEDQTARNRAAIALGQAGGERAIEILLETLNTSDEYEIMRAARALGQIGEERALTSLLAAIKDKRARVRQAVIQALGQISGEQVVIPLLEALGDEDDFVRSNASKTLGQIGDEALRESLVKALAHSDSDVRRKAGEVVGYYAQGPAVLDTLTRLAESDPADEVRKVAGEARDRYERKLRYFGLL
jgi:HEAT repeat protein/energy-coupling factor transporter ATP-binding protein EcfA2